MRLDVGVLSDTVVDALGRSVDAGADRDRMTAAAAAVPYLDADTLLVLAVLAVGDDDPVGVGHHIADTIGVQ